MTEMSPLLRIAAPSQESVHENPAKYRPKRKSPPDQVSDVDRLD
jgi:hypothetical protein